MTWKLGWTSISQSEYCIPLHSSDWPRDGHMIQLPVHLWANQLWLGSSVCLISTGLPVSSFLWMLRRENLSVKGSLFWAQLSWPPWKLHWWGLFCMVLNLYARLLELKKTSETVSPTPQFSKWEKKGLEQGRDLCDAWWWVNSHVVLGTRSPDSSQGSFLYPQAFSAYLNFVVS